MHHTSMAKRANQGFVCKIFFNNANSTYGKSLELDVSIKEVKLIRTYSYKSVNLFCFPGIKTLWNFMFEINSP